MKRISFASVVALVLSFAMSDFAVAMADRENDEFQSAYNPCLLGIEKSYADMGRRPKFIYGEGFIALPGADGALVYSANRSVSVKDINGACVPNPHVNAAEAIKMILKDLKKACENCSADKNINPVKRRLYVLALRSCTKTSNDYAESELKRLNEPVNEAASRSTSGGNSSHQRRAK